MPTKPSKSSNPLLPTVNERGTYAWAEEVVECIVAAWRTHDTAEQAFLVAAKAALEHRIWEVLSPPPPQEPYTSLTNLIRRHADPGQAEEMQLVIKFSGIDGDEESSSSGAIAAYASRRGGASEVLHEVMDEQADDPEVQLGRQLLAQYEQAVADTDAQSPQRPIGLPAGITLDDVMRALGSSGTSRKSESAHESPAQRKRESLEKTRPDLMDAVQSREMTLKQPYVEAGIEKQISALDRLQKLWRSANEEERDRFLSWLKQELDKEHKADYRERVYDDI